MPSQNLQMCTIAKLMQSEAHSGSVSFDADEAALVGAFFEDAIGDDDIDDSEELEL